MAARGASGARRIVLNRAAFDEISLAVADGALELAKSAVEAARVPDAAPFGEGLVQGGAAIAFISSKRVGLWSKTGASVTKPKKARLTKGAITVFGGYGFPGRFVEVGTSRTRAQPFLTPAIQGVLPDAGPFIRAACERRKIVGRRRP